MSLLVIDNYDSFTWNLVHYAENILGRGVVVKRNDQVSLHEIDACTHIILSPGPGLPQQAGIMPDVLRHYAEKKNILGICLGHQGIAERFGGKLYNLDNIYHGMATPVNIKHQTGIFHKLPARIDAGRYHSWAVERETLPGCFEITAEDDNGVIMAMKHKTLPLIGIQFHPESILTPSGYQILENWMVDCR